MKNETGKKRKIEKVKDILEGKNNDLGRMVDRMDEFIDVAKTLNSTIENFKSVRVENLGDIQFPENLEVSNLKSIPRDTVVGNFPEVQKAEITNFPEHKEVKFPDVQKSEITNWPEEKQVEEPSWLGSLFTGLLDSFLDKLAVLAKLMWRQTLTVKRDEDDRFRPQYVVLLDPETAKPMRVMSNGDYHTMVANGGGGGFETIWLKNISGQRINPSTEETLNLLLTQLQAINANTDQLELKADTINLNTDTLEAKIQAVRDQLDVLLSTRASEATLIQVRDYVDSVEAKLQTVIDQTDTIEPKLQTLIDGELWQRQAVAGMGYVVTTNNILIANNAENDFLLVKNPTGSGKTVRIERIIFGSDENQANKSSFFRIYRDPTITSNGTTLVINNLKKGSAAGVMTAFKIPTISARGTLMSVGSYQAPRVSEDTELAVMLQPGENILITIDPTAAGFDHQTTVYFSES